MTAQKKMICDNTVREALRLVVRWSDAGRLPTAADFTEEQRFQIFRRVMHENVWPASEMVRYEGRFACAWTYSVWSWRHGGRRGFSKRVREAAMKELNDADYSRFDLGKIIGIVGEDAHRFARLLRASDVAEMEQRMNGMEADLAVIDRKLDAFERANEAFGELRYRIDLYDCSFEAVIRGGKGGWLWTTLAP